MNTKHSQELYDIIRPITASIGQIEAVREILKETKQEERTEFAIKSLFNALSDLKHLSLIHI